MLDGIINHTIKIRKIFQDRNDRDGFSVELENGKIVDIAYTQWNTAHRKREHDGGVLFSTNRGCKIYFSQNQLKNELIDIS